MKINFNLARKQSYEGIRVRVVRVQNSRPGDPGSNMSSAIWAN
jgi:hypothetical protein